MVQHSEVLMAELQTLLDRSEQVIKDWIRRDLQGNFDDYVTDYAAKHPSADIPDSDDVTTRCERHLGADNFVNRVYTTRDLQDNASWSHGQQVTRFVGRSMKSSFGRAGSLVKATDERSSVYWVLYHVFLYMRTVWDESRQEVFDEAPTNGHAGSDSDAK